MFKKPYFRCEVQSLNTRQPDTVAHFDLIYY